MIGTITYIKKGIFLSCVSSLFLLPLVSYSAELYINPPVKEVHYGDTFITNVLLDNGGECINVVDATIYYDNNIIEAVDFSMGESLITLWVDPPVINHTLGTITFSGGIPGGYCGRIIGDPGPSNLLGKIIFNTTGNQINSNPGDVASISVSEESIVLINDGLGSPAELQTAGGYVTVLEERAFVVNEWLEQISKDTIPPQPFEIIVHQDENIEKGKYFVVFTTTDKQSGIDHFEIFESSFENPGYEAGTNKPAQWRVIGKKEQYYVLQDQTLSSKVIIKAVDKANNEQIAELSAKDTLGLRKLGTIERIFIVTIGIGVFVLLLGIGLLLRRRKNKKEENIYDEGA